MKTVVVDKETAKAAFQEDIVRFQEHALLATMKKNAIIRRYRREYDSYQAVIMRPPADNGLYMEAIRKQNKLRVDFVRDIENLVNELIDQCYGRESVAYTLMFRMGWQEVLYWIYH